MRGDQFGAFSLQNLVLSASLSIPFVGKPASLRFALSERHHPFLVTVTLFGGGGFLALTVSANGMKEVEASSKSGVPSRAGGSLADAKQNDAQSGIEATTVMFATVQAGINFVMHSAGILDSYNVISYDKFLLDEEMTKMALRVRQGVPVDEDTLAYETILDVDHGEQYLTEDHTFEFMRSSLHVSKYFQKSGYASWEQDGKQTAQGNALEALEQRLAAYQETPLTEAQGALIAPYLTY